MPRLFPKSLFSLYLTVSLIGLPGAGASAWAAGSAADRAVTVAKAAHAGVTKAAGIDESIAAARFDVKNDPSNVQALVRLGELLTEKGSLDEALSFFNKALAVNPRAHDAKTGKGVVLARKGQYKEAEAILWEALRLNPNPVRTHYELGLVYEKLGELDRAIEQFKEGIRKHEQGR